MGIDYSGPGSTVNRDEQTGIRYGIVPLHTLADFAFDEFESEYDTACPACGELAPEGFDTCAEKAESGFSGHMRWGARCPACGEFAAEDSWSADEPSSQTLDSDGYQGMLDSSGDVWIFKSPYYTIAGFCSPCAPGAVYLLTKSPDAKAYCLGHDWFEDGKAPYRVFRVDTDEEIMPEVQS